MELRELGDWEKQFEMTDVGIGLIAMDTSKLASSSDIEHVTKNKAWIVCNYFVLRFPFLVKAAIFERKLSVYRCSVTC